MGRMFKFALLRSETRSPSGSVAHRASQHRWVFAGQIAARKVMSIALFGVLRVWFCRVERRSLARDRLSGCQQVNLDEPEGATRFLLRSLDAQQQPILMG